MEILRYKQQREQLFAAMLAEFNYDVSYDWFTDYFQDEHADRKNKKQDFTPRSLTTLVSALIGDDYNG
ncbi:methylase, partial [Niallia circulans]